MADAMQERVSPGGPNHVAREANGLDVTEPQSPGKMARVDVAIPCYNYGRFLGDCVSSVLAQRGVEVRVLVIDNASSDNSLAVAQCFSEEDRRVQVIAHTENRGASFSYNEGIDWATYEYFLILDADDRLAPGALARAAALLDHNPAMSFTHGVEARQTPDGAVWLPPIRPGPETLVTDGADFIRGLCRTPVNSIGANTVVRRTSAQKQVGHYRANLPYTDDLEMWLRLATTGDVGTIRTVQAIRRDHASRMSTQYQSVRDFIEREKAFSSFFAHEGREVAEADALMSRARRGIGEHAYWSAVAHLARGHARTGAELLRLSRRWRPGGSLMPPLGWLARMDRPFARAVEVASEAAGLRRPRSIRKATPEACGPTS